MNRPRSTEVYWRSPRPVTMSHDDVDEPLHRRRARRSTTAADGTTAAAHAAAEVPLRTRASSRRSRSRAPPRPRPARPSRAPRTAASCAPEDVDDDGLPTDRFLDREISWLQFNERVLQLAADENVPLLERARFLAIFTSNLDEFFMVRVAGLKRRIATGLAVRSASGLEPREVLEQISVVATSCSTCRPGSTTTSCSRPSRRRASRSSAGTSSPRRSRSSSASCSPTGSSPCSPRSPSTRPTRSPTSPGCRSTSPCCSSTPRRARSTSPGSRSRRCSPACCGSARPASAGDIFDVRFVPLEDVMAAHLDQLFPGMEVHEHYTFRVTRNEDLEVEEDDAENLLAALEKELTRRRFGPPVRLEVDRDMDDHVMDLLVRELGVSGRGGLPPARSARPARAQHHRRPRALRPALPGVRRAHQQRPRADRERQGPRHLREHPQAGRPAPAPLRLVLDVGAGVHRAGRGRPQRARHQADPLPHERRLPDHRRPHRRGRQRQAGARRRRDQGPLRRAEQHLVGPQARARRASTSSTASSASRRTPSSASSSGRRRTGCAATATSAPATTTPRPPASTRTSACSPCDPQVADDLTRLFNQLSGVAPRSKFKRLLVAPRSVRTGLARAHRGRRSSARRPKPGTRLHRHQGQLDRRRAGHRRALPRLAGRREGRRLGARHLRRCAPASRACPRTSPSTRSSAASSSTPASSSSAPATTSRRGSAAPT